jgi:hypothetical protein
VQYELKQPPVKEIGLAYVSIFSRRKKLGNLLFGVSNTIIKEDVLFIPSYCAMSCHIELPPAIFSSKRVTKKASLKYFGCPISCFYFVEYSSS